MGVVGLAKKAVATTTTHQFVRHTNSQESKEVENELSEQVTRVFSFSPKPLHSPFLSVDGASRGGGGRGCTEDQRTGKGRAAAPGKPAALRHVPHPIRRHLEVLQEGCG